MTPIQPSLMKRAPANAKRVLALVNAKRVLAYTLSAAIAFPAPLYAAATDISQQPLAQPATNVKPNIMLLFDDSGSMRQQYTPDYLGRYFGGSNPLCFDAKDSSNNITGGLNNCEAGDVPLMSPDINTQYYNPEIQYLPAVNYDGSSKTNMSAANTTNWTVVPTDNVTTSSVTVFKKDTRDMNSGGSVVNTENLVTGYPDRVWCIAQGDSATGPNCRTNSAYSYPDNVYGYGTTNGTTLKYRDGPPYYYRLAATAYCSDLELTTCTASSVPTGEFIYPAPVRYCTGGTTNTASTVQFFASCQSKYRETGTTYTYPRFLGNVNLGAGSPGAVGVGTITINTQKDTAAGAITAITVNGVNISGAVNLAASFTQAQAATAIKNAINTTGATTTPKYHATCTGAATTSPFAGNCTASTVTVRYGDGTFTASPIPTATGTPALRTGTPGTTPNGFTITPSFNVTGTTAATATATISGTSSGDSISTFTVGGISLIAAGFSCPSGATCGSGTPSPSFGNNYMATTLRDAINAQTGATGYSAMVASAVVIITAPAAFGSSVNGVTAASSSPGMTVARTAFAGGVTTGDVDLSTANFTAGQDVVAAGTPGRLSVGNFTRVDITPFQDPPTNSIPKTFNKYPDRDDCVASPGVCSYAEEMTNFANWYAYYRSRSQMAKTAIGRAFIGITNVFRVGFLTINPSSTTLGTRFLAVNDFNSGASAQKDLWYQRLYGTTDNGSTPLREALSRVGQYYAGATSTIKYAGMGASPIQVACQPSYTILVTDGYWNGNAGQNLSGAAIGNQDNVDTGYSKRSETASPGGGRYDGAVAGSTDTLADVAMYYYKTDLRTDLSDQVPVTSKDPAPHQHMTTFTVGLGLAGRLSFDKGYENGTSPDFEKLKLAPGSGGINWPVPAANDETALDDLWHAAVNGRGTFFSAKDPAELSNGIAETLTSVQARVGAGAAAATSNLQPVAGDNFAFTAQYETVTWIGDIKARTIDLSTGTVSSRQLWSAAALLDARDQTTRRIYTLDAADTSPPTAPANGNRLKSFCFPAAMGTAGYPTCTDGAGLDAELNYFLTLATSPAPGNEPRLAQSPPWDSDLSTRITTATRESLVDYLRGARLNETTGGAEPSDLYRNRTSILGDIINAQPAYVKGSPFSYNTGAAAGSGDTEYVEFRNTTNGVTGTRKGTVYVAANDGMLHAFETDPDNVPYYQTGGIGTTATGDDTFTGTLDTSVTSGEGSERWAYIPGMLVPYLKRLADTPYTHRYYTDGNPLVGDACFDVSSGACPGLANWRTVLVAGLNAGGRGYYALDVTDPDNPKALWEFKGGASATNCGMTDAQAGDGARYNDCNVGLTFGNPLIVKRPSDGRWVVIFTSGYNNVGAVAADGDGKGYIYIVDVKTGLILQRKGTGVGCDGVSTTAPCVAGTIDPSGLGKINAWVDSATINNTALTLYAGDLKGNLWRYELDGTAFPTVTAGSLTRLASLVDPAGAAQQITTKPELGLVNGKRVVFIGTGKFLGDSDKTNLQRNSFYAIMDNMNSITSPVVTMTRAGSYPTQTISGFARQTLIPSAVNPATERTTAVNTDVPFSSPTDKGWFIDFPDGGTAGNPSERVNVDPILQLGTLVVPSNVPNSDTCVAGGYGWINFLDYKSGTYIPGSSNNMASQKISSSLVVGINVVQLPGGTVKTIVTTADNQQLTESTPVAPSTVIGRRVSWRELFSE